MEGKCFEYLSEKSETNCDKIVDLCVISKPKNVSINGFGNSLSNFLTHFKRKHGKEI